MIAVWALGGERMRKQGNHTLSGFVASLCCYAFEFRFSGEASLCVVR